ncbi:hypothetical protein Clacol_006287 [Clathrus columnatus]|uniref:Phorbol-ester/DAG-type domain-containing protein n=1 Tax=Clathrus columnatus TaxID=1419009 RepID=A0AAV5ABM8_9AGAM|nr:hypothetical protein Clacol_006287 [Clathrus columnatus]
MPRKRKFEEIITDIALTTRSSTRRTSKINRNEPQTTFSEQPMEEEKRLARYKAACPQNIRQRVERVMTQRFFMVERNRHESELREEFKVLGSTALLSPELAYIFAHAPAAPNSVSNPRIQAAYSKAVGRSTTEDETQSVEKKRKIEEDDSCPVCYEEMHGINEKLLVFCQVCGNALHKECFQQCKPYSFAF